MRKISISVIAIIIVAAIFLAGEAYAYLPSDRGFSSNVNVTDDSIQYSIGAQGAYVSSAILIDNGDLKPVKELYIYRDTTYKSDVYEEGITATGSQVFTQDYYIDQLTKNLRFRGVTNIKIMGAEELRAQLQSDIDAALVSQKGLVFIAGAIPNIIFGDSDILENWIDSGGFLYWAGNVIGRSMSTHDDVITVNKQSEFVGTDSFSGWKTATEDTKYRSTFSYENQRLEYTPDTSGQSSDILKTGITDDGTHYSVTFIKKGNGQICICGGSFHSPQIHDMAISIASGLTYKSQVIDFKESEFNRSFSNSFVKPVPAGNISIYISVGKYHCAYAERHDLF